MKTLSAEILGGALRVKKVVKAPWRNILDLIIDDQIYLTK